QPLLPSIGTAPLRFIIRDGNVTLVGSVPSADLRQQIESTVAQVPGVAAIVNRSGDGAMSINRAATVTTPAPTADGSATVGSATPASGVTIVPPAAFPITVATNQFGTGGALPPTGRVPGPINPNPPVLPNVTNVPPAPAPRTP
ncbi:MAG TPA: BON domain-containing protein, partial [Methylomirabilota bacterium]|nr:BON domain-containing protein [Methylomirabilota bacterium]